VNASGFAANPPARLATRFQPSFVAWTAWASRAFLACAQVVWWAEAPRLIRMVFFASSLAPHGA
jgi:hypothetical protein